MAEATEQPDLVSETESLLSFLNDGEAPEPETEEAEPAAAEPKPEKRAAQPAKEPPSPEEPAAEKAEGEEEPVDAAELQRRQVALAREAFQKRERDRAVLRAQVEEERSARLKAEKAAEEQRLDREWIKAAIAAASGQDPAQPAAEEPKSLLDDPDGYAARVEAENKALRQEMQQLKERFDKADQTAAQRRAEQEQIQAEFASYQEEAQLWEAQVPGFLGKYDPTTGQVTEPGIFEDWREAFAGHLRSLGVPEHRLVDRIGRQVREFRDLSQESGQPWPYHLELHAAALGVRAEAPENGAAPAAPVPAAPKAPSPAAQDLAAARQAQEELVAGSIGAGSQSPPAPLGKTAAEMRAAGVDPREYAALKLREHNGNPGAMIEELLRLEGFGG